MLALAWALIIGLTISSAVWFGYRARSNGRRRAGTIVWAVAGGAVYLILFFVLNGLVDANMPTWFYRFINEHGDPAGVCLVLVATAAVNFVVGLVVAR